MFFTDTHKLNKTAYDALKRIRQNKEKMSSLVLENENKLVARHKFNLVFQEYSEEKLQEKIALDSYIYNKLLENLSSDEQESVSTLIAEMMTTVRDIYKFINIEPKSVGFNNMTSADSKNSLVIEASNIINNHINKEYYSLSKDEKIKKYKDSVIHLAHKVVLEDGVDPQEAIDHSYKSIVIERFLENINFPFIIKHKIDEVFEDDIYNDFFNIDELKELKETFESQIKNISRVVSILIK
jgi:hypothetical protein